MLQVQHLSYSHDTSILLSDIYLSVSTGEVVCLTGPNGAGKSTLLHCVSGRLRPQSGTILLPPESRVGIVSQEHDVLPTDSVEHRIWSYSPRLSELHERIQRDDYEAISEYQSLGGYQLANKVED